VNVSLQVEFTPHPAAMYKVYVLKSKEMDELYYGYTNDLERRLSEHNKEKDCWELVYYEAYKSEIDARTREKRLKQYAQALTALKGRIKNSLK